MLVDSRKVGRFQKCEIRFARGGAGSAGGNCQFGRFLGVSLSNWCRGGLERESDVPHAVVLDRGPGGRDAGPDVPIPQPTDNLDDVRQVLTEVAVVPLATDLSGAVARAEALARGGNAASKEVYVFSDLQDAGWEESPDGPGGSDVAIT